MVSPTRQCGTQVGQFVRDMAHTSGIESFWALLKHGYYGIYGLCKKY